VLFTMPQYFQGVRDIDAMGSGLRLLPVIGGLVIGALPADQVVRLVGAKVAAAAGFVLLAAGLSLGATTAVNSSAVFVATWMAIVGAGMGLALATASSAALAEMSEERSGVASAVLQAVNKVGGPFGTAILGSVLSAGYLAHLNLSGLPPSAAAAVRQSVFGGVAVARHSGSAALLASVHSAFVHGMDMALVVSAGIALAGAVLTLCFLPRANASTSAPAPGRHETEETVAQTR
jgi:MFS transporter, DHA2 family, multidrug resistance protein